MAGPLAGEGKRNWYWGSSHAGLRAAAGWPPPGHRLTGNSLAESHQGAKPIYRRKNVAKDTYSGSFYCVKCKDHREATGDVVVNEKGTRIAKAKCPVCGTNLTRFLPKA